MTFSTSFAKCVEVNSEKAVLMHQKHAARERVAVVTDSAHLALASCKKPMPVAFCSK